MKGLSTKQSIYSAFSVDMHCYIVCDSSTAQEKFLEGIFRFDTFQ